MYKIAVLAHALKGNRVAKFNDIVSEKELNGNAKDLEKKGYIVKATNEEIKVAQKAKAGTDAQGGSDDHDFSIPVKDMNKATLLAYAEKLGVEMTDAESNNEKRAAKIQEFLDTNN